MTAARSRKEQVEYKTYTNAHNTSGATCQFCAIGSDSPQFVSQTVNFKIIRNIFSYSVWDGQRVTDHLLVIPVIHTDSLKNIPAVAAKEYLELISAYEQKGYNVYARAPGSNKKSVVHQHTHLIKLDGRHMKFLFHIRKPYIRFVR